MATQALMQALGRNLAMEGSAGPRTLRIAEPEVLPPIRLELLEALLSRPGPVIHVARRSRLVATPMIRRLVRAKPVAGGSV